VDLRQRIALVTGGGGAGLGRAIALQFSREGATVVVADLDLARAEETVNQIAHAGGNGAAVQVDVTAEPDVQRMISFAERTFGGLDVLVNNAGETPAPHFPDAPVAHWSRVLDLNLRGPMLATQHVLPAMRARGGGAIVNVSSIAGLGYGPHDSPEYSAAKAGLIRLTTTLAPLAQRDGVRVNCVVPNWIGTRAVIAEVEAMSDSDRAEAEVPSVLTPPEEIAEGVLAFVRNDSLAGRVLVWWSTERSELVAVEDA
jgi:NAD(P)-dependent dehydrogenase (short-subunit alcohol dehydrogenase family)